MPTVAVDAQALFKAIGQSYSKTMDEQGGRKTLGAGSKIAFPK